VPARVWAGMASHQPRVLMVTWPRPVLAAVSYTLTAVGLLAAVVTATGSTCTLPTDSTTYPVAVTTAASSPTAVKVYDTAASTGLGQVTISNVGWWLAIPANTLAGTYTSTITVQVNSGP
jgi:uncharacterized protein (UPF0333 family)